MKMKIMLPAIVAAVVLTGGLRAQEGKPDSGGVFKRLDSNADGKLTADEVPAEKRDFFDRALRAGDADGDGALDAAEFARAFAGSGDSDRERDSRRRRPDSSRGSRDTPSPADFIRRFDKDGDGKVTREELPQNYRLRIGKRFSEYDKNEDGALNEAEVAALLKSGASSDSRRPSRTPSRSPGRMRDTDSDSQDLLFSILDRDRDGKLSKRELQAAASIIERLDRDRDGALSKRELAAGTNDRSSSDRKPSERSSRDRASRERISSYIKGLDENSDGRITREEARGPVKERFDSYDQDGDGVLKVDEVIRDFGRTRSRSSRDEKKPGSRDSKRGSSKDRKERQS